MNAVCPPLKSVWLMALGVIPEPAYESFAKRFFAKAGRPFDADAFRHLYTRFEGITWYVQTVLNRIWSSGLGLDSPRQVDNAVAAIVAESNLFYHDLLRSQTAAEQAILKAVGREGVVPAISARDFISRHGLPAASTIRSAVAKLQERDLLYRSEQGFLVYDRFFGLWLTMPSSFAT